MNVLFSPPGRPDPGVCMADATIEAVKRILSSRQTKSLHDPSLMPAAVLLLLYPKDGEYCILLNKRSDQVEYHKGEVSFPGGGKDPEDKDFLDTALRETFEEMGVKPDDVTVLGQLDDVATRSSFEVRVFVGTIPYPYPYRPSAREISKVLEVPIRGLLDPANRREEVRWLDGKVSKAYCYVYGEHLIYGATAQILTQFLELLPGIFRSEGELVD